MSTLALTLPVIGQPNTTEDVKIANAFTAVQTWGNGNLGASNLDGATNAQLGSNDGTTVRRGKSIIATSEARTNVAYGLLATPDRVQSVVLTTDGLLAIAYQATWQESVNAAARAAIFIGANQLKGANAGIAAPGVQEASLAAGGGGTDVNIASGSLGLTGNSGGGGAYTGDVSTGQILGGTFGGGAINNYGPCYVFAAAGTYDVSVQFKSSSGSVTVKNRKLWVWTIGF